MFLVLCDDSHLFNKRDKAAAQAFTDTCALGRLAVSSVIPGIRSCSLGDALLWPQIRLKSLEMFTTTTIMRVLGKSNGISRRNALMLCYITPVLSIIEHHSCMHQRSLESRSPQKQCFAEIFRERSGGGW